MKSGCARRRTSTVVLVGSATKYSILTSTCWKNSSMSSHIGGGLHQVLQRRPGGREGHLEVLTYLANLCAHVAFANNIAMTVTGQLSGNKDGASPFYYDDVGIKHVILHDNMELAT